MDGPDLSVRCFAFLVSISAFTLIGCNGGGNAPDAGATDPDNDDTPSVWFVDERADIGIDFSHTSTHSTDYLMPENVPAGGAVLDYDNDGDLDVYLIQSGDVRAEEGPGNQLFRNDGGVFTEVTAESGDAADRGFGMGVACGDYDNDGDVDIFVTNLGPNVLLRNDRGVFTDVTDTAGLATADGHDAWGTSAAFADIDDDGDLDLYACNYINWSLENEPECFNNIGERDYCAPKNYKSPDIDVLYLNNGDGTFTDITETAGLRAAYGNGLGIGPADFNGDGRIDFFIANDQTPDQLWINQGLNRAGIPTFKDESTQRGCAVDLTGTAKAGMGVTVADLDNDRDFDLLVCNIQDETDSLYVNDDGVFNDSTLRFGLGTVPRRFTRFGLGWVDFNKDGRLDLYQANGRVGRQQKIWKDGFPYTEPNVVFEGMDDGKFKEVMPRGGTADLIIESTRAAIFADLNNDGAMDVIAVNQNAQPNILMNQIGDSGNWIMLDLRNEHGSPAHGAVINAAAGEIPITRMADPAYSYCASNDPRIHIGLGDQTLLTDIVITWSSGETERFNALEAGRIHTIRESGAPPE